ncbi:MAG: transporter substrate-binding protein [Massilia sp.]|nr:transporter substrate-binding protein [Massilia sp.]
MHLSHLSKNGGNKATKLAVVAGVHLAVGALFVHSLNSRHFQMPKIAEELVVMFTPEAPPPLPPPEPPQPMPHTAPPQIVAPPIEVQVQQPAPPSVVTTAVALDPPPQPPTATPQEAPRPATPPSSNTGVMRTAVLADAKACVTPAYPPRAARNGESGTVTLALLVGSDGRVAGSRVQTSSGSRELDKAAVAALSTCQFKPATNGGVAEQAWAQIAYVWTLEQ